MTNPKSKKPLALMVSLFFVFGIITVFNDVLIPHLKSVFELSYFEAILIQFAFFSAYFLMAIPSSKIIQSFGYKKSIILGLGIIVIGCLTFLPASSLIYYPLFLLALFIMASGITLLQVAANPYLSSLGDPEKASSRLNLAGGFNSFATVIGPLIGAHYILNESFTYSNPAAAVQKPYFILAMLVLALLLIAYYVKLPEISSKEDQKAKGALKFRHLKLGIIAIFLYVGAEVSIGSFLINFLGLDNIAGLPEDKAAKFVSFYWGGAMVGRFIGFGFLHKVSSSKALVGVACIACLLVVTGLLSSGFIAAWSLTLVGLCNSIMWPCIFPLAIKNLGKYTSEASGLLIMGVVGGAIIPLIQGAIADNWSLQGSFALIILCYAYLIYYGFAGHKELNK